MFLFPVKVLKCYYIICIISVVFMGSEKYPDENEFDVFIKKHGGFQLLNTRVICMFCMKGSY